MLHRIQITLKSKFLVFKSDKKKNKSNNNKATC